jgi:type I restriction enzyme S subunit
LCEVCDFRPQKKEAKDLLKETDLVSFLPMEDLGVLNRNIIPKKEKQLKEVSGSYTYFAEDDVLLAKITPCFENGKIGIARNLTNGIGFGSSEYIVFRQKGALISDYLYFFLSRKIIREEGRKYMSGAVGHKRVSKDWIENYIIQYPKSKEKQFLLVKKIGNLSNEIIKLEKLYQQKLNDLDELKKSILQKAFNGELKTSKISA